MSGQSITFWVESYTSHLSRNARQIYNWYLTKNFLELLICVAAFLLQDL